MGTKKNSLYFNMVRKLDEKFVKIVHRFMTGCECYQLLVLEYVGPHKGNEKIPKYFYFWTNQANIIVSAGSNSADIDTETLIGHLYLRSNEEWVRYSPVVANLSADDSSGRNYKNETQFDAFIPKLAIELTATVKAIVVSLVGTDPKPAPTRSDIQAFVTGCYAADGFFPGEVSYNDIGDKAKEIFDHITGFREIPAKNREGHTTFTSALKRCCELFGDPFEEK